MFRDVDIAFYLDVYHLLSMMVSTGRKTPAMISAGRYKLALRAFLPIAGSGHQHIAGFKNRENIDLEGVHLQARPR